MQLLQKSHNPYFTLTYARTYWILDSMCALRQTAATILKRLLKAATPVCAFRILDGHTVNVNQCFMRDLTCRVRISYIHVTKNETSNAG